MTTREREYQRRRDAILEHRSIRDASNALGLPYPTLAKWYHDRREEFPDEIVEAIKKNGGRPLRQSRIGQLVQPLDTADISSELRPAADMLQQITNRIQELMDENDRLRQENDEYRKVLAGLPDVLRSAS